MDVAAGMGGKGLSRVYSGYSRVRACWFKGLGSNPSPFLGGGDANRVSELNACHSLEWG